MCQERKFCFKDTGEKQAAQQVFGCSQGFNKGLGSESQGLLVAWGLGQSAGGVAPGKSSGLFLGLR